MIDSIITDKNTFNGFPLDGLGIAVNPFPEFKIENIPFEALSCGSIMDAGRDGGFRLMVGDGGACDGCVPLLFDWIGFGIGGFDGLGTTWLDDMTSMNIIINGLILIHPFSPKQLIQSERVC